MGLYHLGPERDVDGVTSWQRGARNGQVRTSDPKFIEPENPTNTAWEQEKEKMGTRLW